MGTYVALAALIFLPVMFVHGAVSHVLPALRTGRLQARGRVYERKGQPIRFWLGIAFWIFSAVLFIFTSVFLFMFVDIPWR
jgi:hypothetical protein